MSGIHLNRVKIESVMNRAQLRLEKREPLWAAMNERYELFIAAGESEPPHQRFRKFGITKDEFPGGCFVTMAFIMKGEDKLVLGIPAFYEKNHNPELTEEGKKQARINRCRTDALEHFRKRNSARKGLILHG